MKQTTYTITVKTVKGEHTEFNEGWLSWELEESLNKELAVYKGERGVRVEVRKVEE